MGAAIVSLAYKEKESFSLNDHIICVIETGCYSESDGLAAGYGYYLLEKYSESCGKTLDIRLSNTPGLVDSLRSGAIDVLVLPMRDTVDNLSGLTISNPIDSLLCWVLDEKYSDDVNSVNKWIEQWQDNHENDRIRQRFLNTFNPYRRKSGSSFLSPYDDIIRKYASHIKWDWRLLAAVIYQESHFRIDVKSRRGAMGLMQMMPGTAEQMGVEDIINPEKGIEAGAKYLHRLSRGFKFIDDEDEMVRFTLASYNAGAARINDCIEYAREQGVDPTIWDNIVSIIPNMREEGLFQGIETIAYVETVLGIYGEFCRICP